MYLEIRNTEDKQNLYSRLKRMQLPYYVAFGHAFRMSTDNQRRYYRKCIIDALAKETGQSKEETENELLKENACVREYDDEAGDHIWEVERTSGMTTMRMEQYLEDCRRYALVKHGVYLLKPHEVMSEYLELHGATKKIVERND